MAGVEGWPALRLCLLIVARRNGATPGERPWAAADVARGVAASHVHHLPAKWLNAGREIEGGGRHGARRRGFTRSPLPDGVAQHRARDRWRRQTRKGVRAVGTVRMGVVCAVRVQVVRRGVSGSGVRCASDPRGSGACRGRRPHCGCALECRSLLPWPCCEVWNRAAWDFHRSHFISCWAAQKEGPCRWHRRAGARVQTTTHMKKQSGSNAVEFHSTPP